MLFWKDLNHTLTCWRFEVNPIDWCVANKTIEGKLCTVLWHVDDIKISHVNKDVVSSVLDLPIQQIWQRGTSDLKQRKNSLI